MKSKIQKDIQFYKFCTYGFLKNLRFFDPFIFLFFLNAGLSYFQIGILAAVREITNNILEIPSGLAADAFGRRKAMILSFTAYIISFLIFFIFNNYIYFIIGMIFFGIGEAFRTGTHKAMILHYLNSKGISDQKVHYYGATRASSKAGSAISSIIAALIVFFTQNYNAIFLLSIIPYLINMILIISYPAYLDGTPLKINFYKDTSQYLKQTFKSFLEIFKNKTALTTILNSSYYEGTFKSSKDYIQPVLLSLATSLPFLSYQVIEKRTALISGFVYFIIFAGSSAASGYSGKITEKFKNQSSAVNFFYLITILILIISGIFINYQIYSIAVIFILLFYIVENIKKPVSISCIADHINIKIMASGLSAESLFKTLFAAILAPLTGFIADKFNMSAAFSTLGLMLFIFFPLLKLKEKH